MIRTLLFVFTLAWLNAAMAQQEGIINMPDGVIHYRSYGTGRPLLIINGGPGMNSDGFVPLAKTLSAYCRAVIYDQRGTGLSTLDRADSTTVTLDKMIGDIETLREKLKINTWVVLGHSFGGMLGSYYATQHPEHIDKLILSSSGGIDLDLFKTFSSKLSGRLSPSEADSLAYWNKRMEEGDTSYHAKLRRGMALAPAYLYNRKYIPVIAERLTQSKFAIMNLVWQDMGRMGFDCSEGLKRFTKPALIIQGREDIVDASLAEKAHSVLKNSKLVFMDRCVHYGWLDRPDLYFSELQKFISGS